MTCWNLGVSWPKKMAAELSISLISNVQSAAMGNIKSPGRLKFEDDILSKCGYESLLRLECIREISPPDPSRRTPS